MTRLTSRKGPGDRSNLSVPRGGTRIPSLYDADAFGRFSEALARFLGTGRYLVGQTLFVIGWIVLNTWVFVHHWDPYPYILLNLAFSTQAAYAAPLILLAQNRQDDRDRISLEEDRARAAQTKADTEFMARELAALRIAIGEVATRDYLRSELDRLRAELAGGKKQRDKHRKSSPSAEDIRDDPRWDDEETVTQKS